MQSAQKPVSAELYACMLQGSKEYNLRDILTVIFKHKYLILIALVVATLATPIAYHIFVAHFAQYEGSSLLMIRDGREYTRPNFNVEAAPLQVGLPEILSSEMAILSSRDLKSKVISTLGLGKIYPQLAANEKIANPMDVAVLLFNSSLSVQPVQSSNLISSNLIKVSFRDRNPQVAALAVNELINAYQEQRMRILSDSKPVLLLEDKVTEYREKLKQSQDKLQAFRQEHQIISYDDQRKLLLEQHIRLDAAAKSTQTQVKELEQKLSTLEGQIKTIPATVPLPLDKDGVTQAEFQLLALQQKEQELLSKYKESNIFVTTVQNQIQMAKEFLDGQKKKSAGSSKTTANQLYQTLQKDIISARVDLSATIVRNGDLHEQFAAVAHQLNALDRQEEVFRDLKREFSLNESSYEAYLKKLEEVRISADMDRQKMTSVSVIEKAATPIVPVSPREGVLFFTLIGGLVGVVLGVFLAFALEFVKNGANSPHAAESNLGLKVLSVIPDQRG